MDLLQNVQHHPGWRKKYRELQVQNRLSQTTVGTDKTQASRRGLAENCVTHFLAHLLQRHERDAADTRAGFFMWTVGTFETELLENSDKTSSFLISSYVVQSSKLLGLLLTSCRLGRVL